MRHDGTPKAHPRFRKLRLMLALLAPLMALAVTVQSPGASAAENCSGAFAIADIDEAKDAYEANCGQEWNGKSGHHRCDWASDGWTCSGPGQQMCTAAGFPSLAEAKAEFEDFCGGTWDSRSGLHQCGYTGTYEGVNYWWCDGPYVRR